MACPVTRREFIGRAAASGFGLGLGGCLWGTKALAQAPGNRIALGFIGVGGMGMGHLRGQVGNSRVQVVAVCDVDANHLANAVGATRNEAQGYRDYRELLARGDLDAVCISTPDHWHGLNTVDACAAGKDVYVEKPMGHTIAEGRAMVEAARRHGRVVQVGTMQRAQSHFRHVVELVRSGRLGEIKQVRTWFGAGGGGAWVPDSAPPPQLDWDRWLGPAPWVPYNPERVHFKWRYFYDYGGGMMTDWGVHLIDIVQWAMDQDAPLSIEARGTYSAGAYNEVPEEMETEYEFPGFQLSWTQLKGQKWDPQGHGYGIMFHGSEAQLFVDRSGYAIYPEEKAAVIDAPLGRSDVTLPRVRSHWDEFLDCVESRRRPTCDVEVGHRSTSTCSLGTIAFRTGRKLRWDRAVEQFVDDPAAGRLLSRTGRAPYHL